MHAGGLQIQGMHRHDYVRRDAPMVKKRKWLRQTPLALLRPTAAMDPPFVSILYELRSRYVVVH